MSSLSTILIRNIQRLLDGKTPYWLSKETGVSQSTLSKILSGQEKNPRIETVQKIAKGLGHDISGLLTDGSLAFINYRKAMTGERAQQLNEGYRKEIDRLHEVEETARLQKEALAGAAASLKLKDKEMESLRENLSTANDEIARLKSGPAQSNIPADILEALAKRTDFEPIRALLKIRAKTEADRKHR